MDRPAQNYCDLLDGFSSCVNEQRLPYLAGETRISERSLQCLWYDSRIRPKCLATSDGEPVEVVECGRWNLEAGPDFLDAVLLVGTERRMIRGDVEIHTRPDDWGRHGHADDPAYSDVVAHVTYLPGVADGLPPGAVSIQLRDPLRKTPQVVLSDIDVSSFPHASIPANHRPCCDAYGSDPDTGLRLLRSAGTFRMDEKARRFSRLAAEVGDWRQALYESMMSYLGAKHNTKAFRSLARAVKLADLSHDAVANYALLLGAANLLPDIDSANNPLPRRLWDAWWKFGREPLDIGVELRYDAARPANQPFRRLAAAAAMFARCDELFSFLEKPVSATTVEDAVALLRELASFPEVEPLSTLGGEPSKRMALLGESGASMLVTNALVPFLASREESHGLLYDQLAPETLGANARTMAARLFSPDHNPRAIYASDGLAQQGLIQVFNDFCLSDRSGCEKCPLASRNPSRVG